MTSDHSIPILTYHHTEQAPPKGFQMRSLWVTPSSFSAQMLWLARLGYTGLAMSDLMPYLRGTKKARWWVSRLMMATKAMFRRRFPF